MPIHDSAAMAGVARENVSRVLSDWKRRNLVTRSSGFYCLNNITTDKRHAAPVSGDEPYGDSQRTLDLGLSRPLSKQMFG